MRVSIFCSILLLILSSTLNAQQHNNATSIDSDHKVMTGTVLVNDHAPVDFKALMQTLKTDWDVHIDSFNQAEKTLVLYTPEATVMLAHLDYPAPLAEIKSAAEGAWMWNSAADEAPRHQSQVVISVIGSARRPVEMYKLYTRVAAACLQNTRSCGVYLSSQYLLQSKAFFLESARNMDQKVLPIYCWVYFGMFQENELSSGYTFGLTEFGMPDVEINRSRHSLQEIHAVLYDAVKDALENGVRFKEGATIETQEGQKIPLTLSKASFWEGQTLKAAY